MAEGSRASRACRPGRTGPRAPAATARTSGARGEVVAWFLLIDGGIERGHQRKGVPPPLADRLSPPNCRPAVPRDLQWFDLTPRPKASATRFLNGHGRMPT